MGIGYGSDVLTSLAAYLPDPFNWLAIFFPPQYAEYGYCLMIIFKIYACGAVFSWFCLQRGHGKLQTLLGSMIYMFCGTMYIIFIESFFVNPMYIFPLVIAGIDRLFEKRKSTLYVVALAFSFINYFYFAYMTCIFVFLYCLIKYFFRKELSYKVVGKMSVKIFLYSLVAFGISMIVVLPIMEVLLNAGRLGISYFLPTFFDRSYYAGVWLGFINSYSMLGRDALIGYGCMSFIFVVIFFLKDKEHRALKIFFVLLSIGLCVPYFGHVMNGFSYTANRWVWAYSFCIAYISVIAVPLFKSMTRREIYVLTIIVFLYAFIGILLAPQISKAIAITLLALLAMTISICFTFDGVITQKKKYWVLFSLTVFSLILSSYWFYSGKGGNGTREEVARGTGYHLLFDNGVLNSLEQLPDMQQFRYDEWQTGRVRNSSWLSGISGIDFYISIYNNAVDQFNDDIALLTGSSPMDYHGLDKRSELDHLFNVKYFFVNDNNEKHLPYGYDKKILETNLKDNKKLDIFETKYPTSFVYGYNSVLSKDDFSKQNTYNRQQLLMKTCILDNKDISTAFNIANLGDLNIQNDNVDYVVTYDKNVIVQDGTIQTKARDNHVNLSFTPVHNAELYVLLDGINTNEGQRQGFSINIQAQNDGAPLSFTKHDVFTANNKTHMYGGKHSWLVNLGIVNESDSIDLVFPEAGLYRVKNIQIYAKPLTEIEKNIEELKPVTTHINMYNNGFSYIIDDDKYAYSLITIPYSKGWSAKVDGKSVPVLRADYNGTMNSDQLLKF